MILGHFSSTVPYSLAHGLITHNSPTNHVVPQLQQEEEESSICDSCHCTIQYLQSQYVRNKHSAYLLMHLQCQY